MTTGERDTLSGKYTHQNVHLWITDNSDIEAFFLAPERVANLFNLAVERVEEIYREIRDEKADVFENVFAVKRQELAEDRRLHAHRNDAPQVADARREIPEGIRGFGPVHGKKFSKALKAKLNEEGLDPGMLLVSQANEEHLAASLRNLLNGLVGGG